METLLRIQNWDEYFMRHVYLVASKSKDDRTKIGSVIVRDNRVISEGYNGICQGVDDNIVTRYIKPEKYFWFEHSERNAIFGCARNGINTLGAICYTNGIPCSDCARALIQSGISEVVVHKQWENNGEYLKNAKWQESSLYSKKMFQEAGVNLRYFDMELGVFGMTNGKIIKV